MEVLELKLFFCPSARGSKKKTIVTAVISGPSPGPGLFMLTSRNFKPFSHIMLGIEPTYTMVKYVNSLLQSAAHCLFGTWTVPNAKIFIRHDYCFAAVCTVQQHTLTRAREWE